jgi:hypothetical protein
MEEPAGGLRLQEKAFAKFALLGRARLIQKNGFNGNRAFDFGIPTLIDSAHRTAADLGHDLISAQQFAARVSHWFAALPPVKGIQPQSTATAEGAWGDSQSVNYASNAEKPDYLGHFERRLRLTAFFENASKKCLRDEEEFESCDPA